MHRRLNADKLTLDGETAAICSNSSRTRCKSAMETLPTLQSVMEAMFALQHVVGKYSV
jgi:hypothetical protein